MIHIAGPWLNPNDDLLIQRCAACGFSLIDCRIKGMATAEPGNADIATWAFGDLVQVEGNGCPTEYIRIGNLDDYPERSWSKISSLCIAERLRS